MYILPASKSNCGLGRTGSSKENDFIMWVIWERSSKVRSFSLLSSSNGAIVHLSTDCVWRGVCGLDNYNMGKARGTSYFPRSADLKKKKVYSLNRKLSIPAGPLDRVVAIAEHRICCFMALVSCFHMLQHSHCCSLQSLEKDFAWVQCEVCTDTYFSLRTKPHFTLCRWKMDCSRGLLSLSRCVSVVLIVPW